MIIFLYVILTFKRKQTISMFDCLIRSSDNNKSASSQQATEMTSGESRSKQNAKGLSNNFLE